MNFFEELKDYDSEVFFACDSELKRQQGNIELIASENIVSKAVLLAAGGVLTNKYAEGYPGKRYYGGCQYVDVVENTVPKSFSVPTMPMFSPTAEQMPTWLYFLPCFPRETPLWV